MSQETRVEESVDLAATPETVYDVVADVTRWDRFSPEGTGAGVPGAPGRPLDVGDTFTGRNRRGVRRWRTRCTVTSARRGEHFAFQTRALGLPIATWDFRLVPLPGGGTRLTQTWQDERGRLMRAVGLLATGVRDRATHNRLGMRITHRRLRAYLES